jgi:hypothetical protein
MPDQSDSDTTFTALTIEEALRDALASAIATGSARADERTSILMFSGEGATPDVALREALADIQASSREQGCRAIDAQLDGVMRTDEGTRIWGTVECVPDAGDAAGTQTVPDVRVTEDGDGTWTVTIQKV